MSQYSFTFSPDSILFKQASCGADPWSAAGPLAGFLHPFKKADEGVGRGPGGPPHQVSES